MNNDLNNQGISESEGEDVELTELIDEELVSKLDSIRATGNLLKKYSEIYTGGVYALRAKNRRENPDWMSQSANSFREILYVLQQKESKELKEVLQEYLNKSLTKKEVEKYKEYLNNLYCLFSDLTHHLSGVADLKNTTYLISKGQEIKADGITKEKYFVAIKLYKQFLKLLVITALEIHKKIDDTVKNNRRSKDRIKIFFNYSGDSKNYFLSQVDESWLSWLWSNGFFVELKKPAIDKTRIYYRLPELEYLTRIAEKDPKQVANLINSIPIAPLSLNPEVVDRFMWIIGSLPLEQIKFLLPKILRENWVQLMSPFHRSGYEYTKIVQKISEGKDSEALNSLAQVVLTLRAKEELYAMEGFSSSGKLFYLHDLTETGIFNLLISEENTDKEKTLGITLGVLSEVVSYGKDREEEVFSESEPFYLLDVDLFAPKVNSDRRSYTKDDIENLIAVVILLVNEIFSSACGNETELRRLYDTYISHLPDSRTLYRLRLYAATRCPQTFREEIKEGLFRIFKTGERYFEVEGGAEYHHTLIAGFSSLDDVTKREYVKNILEYFGAVLGDADKEEWRKRDGLKILTFIKKDLTKEEIVDAEKLFGKFPDDIELVPHPDSSGVRGGSVSPRSPVVLSDFSVKEIIKHLQTDWDPKVLNEQYRRDDFLNPRGAEGLGDALKEDFKARTDEYFAHLDKFFDRDTIHPSYLYSLLRQIDETLRNKETLSDSQYRTLIELFGKVRISGEAKEFTKSDDKSWLADWITVLKIITDVLLEILADLKKSEVFVEKRKEILGLITYLLSIKYSPNAEDDEREANEPHSVAINSVRGQAFRAFVQFVYNDADKSLADDIKALYEHVLDTETSNAVRFTIGQFFGSFYFRDIPYVTSLLPKIFPINDSTKSKLYFATWEGYLASTLYRELFTDLEDYYKYAILINSSDYPERKYSKGLDESLATHLALAYAHLDFKISDPLFDLFWKTPNEQRHYEFISFIGRSCLTRAQAGDEWIKENNVSKDKLVELWNWMLATDIKIEPKAFSGFGFWINPDLEVIDEKIIVKNLPTTLFKSEGEIDWDYGLTNRLCIFAKIDPSGTLEIIKNFLLFNDELNAHRRSPLFSIDSEIKDALDIIYKDDAHKKGVTDLINLLIEKGGSMFWNLKKVIVTTNNHEI